MKTYKRTQQWFKKEYKYLRECKTLRIEKSKKSESYFTGTIYYDLFFDDFGNYTGSMVSDIHGTPIANYEAK